MWRDLEWPQVLLGTLGVVLVVALVIAAGTSSASFGAYNPAWDGAAELRDVASDTGANVSVVLNTSAYPQQSASGTVALVLSPETAYDARDRARLRAFVRQGGTLVVAEDFGPHGNDLLRAVGASARFDGRLVRDEHTYYRSPALPVAPNVTTGLLTNGVDQVTLDYATVLVPNGSRVLVRTSEFAYLDTNRNDRLDDDESLGRYPVVTVEDVGEGRVVAVSDPSLFINALLDRPGNRRFATNLFASGDRVLLDYSHAGRQPPLAVALLTVRGSPMLQGLVTAGAVGLIVGLAVLWRRKPEPRPGAGGTPTGQRDRVDAVVEALARRHPDWERSRLRRVAEATGVSRTGAQSTDDE